MVDWHKRNKKLSLDFIWHYIHIYGSYFSFPSFVRQIYLERLKMRQNPIQTHTVAQRLMGKSFTEAEKFEPCLYYLFSFHLR